MFRLRLVVALLIAILSATSALAQVTPQDAAEAKKHFDVGLKLYGEKATNEALVEFELSYKLGGRPSALKNIAQCHRDLKHFADAYETYERMLAVHGAQLGAEKPAVERALSELSILTGTIAVQSTQPGAVVSIDGKSIGTTPLDKPKRVSLGAHTITLTKAEFENFSKDVNVGSEQALQVDATLEKEVTTGHLFVREQNNRDVHVIVDGQDQGPLPWSDDLPPGDHTIETKGPKYASDKQIIKVVRKEKHDVVVDASPTTGHLRITVSPASAKIQIDGADHGNGAWEADVTPGTHRIVVSLDGFPDAVREVTVERGQVAQAEIPLIGAMSGIAREPNYKGFYGRWSTPFWFGYGTGMSLPANQSGSIQQAAYISINMKLQLGHSFGWLGLEGVATYMFTGRINDTFVDSSGKEQVKTGYPMMSGFFGAGARVTSKHPIIRFTGGLALGAGPHQILDRASKVARYAPCDNGGGAGCGSGGSPSSPNDQSPGYTAFAMAGDIGILLGNGSPGAKFWVGIDWYVDFPPDITVQGDSRIPSEFTNNGGVTVLHGPQFFIGPVLGVGFGH